MKKIIGGIALALFVFLPFSVNAKISINKDNMKCTSVETNAEGKHYVTCTLNATTTEATESVNAVSFDIVWEDETNIELDEASVKGAGAFNAAVLNNTISYTATQPQTGSTIEIGSFTYYIKDVSKKCGFQYIPTGTDITEPEQTVEIVPENPGTGSAVSYVAIGAGLLLVAGAYVVSRKNTKMYNI